MRIRWNKYILGSSFSLQILPSSLSPSVSPSPSRHGHGRRRRARPRRPPSSSSATLPRLPLTSVSPSPSSLSPSLPMLRQARGGGRCQATAPLRAMRHCGRGSVAPSLPPSSLRPPQRVLPLGSLCSFARRNPRCLCGDGSGGEARPLDLTVTHPLLLLLRPMAPPQDPLSLAFFWERKILTIISMAIENSSF